ncbi:DUF2285 domain-containing protein [Allosphingosinicella vermicomposti]|uniref:DUF2285 domain-containing protein n=1 Tax=Allosphingosinicella vermicomposti TaxID=614671 RepID=UPI00131A5DC9|nr:DUF2285 domain-containing protein [Allosphingosinicella vermicomposti]
MADPDLKSQDVQIAWRAADHPAVVPVDVVSAERPDFDALTLNRDDLHVTIVRSPVGEQLLLGDGLHQVQLASESGSFLHDAVHLRYRLHGLRTLAPKLLTLQRLTALDRLGRFPAGLFPPEGRAGRWIMMLRAADAIAQGARQREIAAALFGDEVAARDWRGGSDFLRLRVQRLVRESARMVAGGYRALLRGREEG